MEKYTVFRLPNFVAALAELEKQYPGCTEPVSVAEKYLEVNCERCGISTNQGQRYFTTRATPRFPILALFFSIDQEKRIVNLTVLGAIFRNEKGDADDAEE